MGKAGKMRDYATPGGYIRQSGVPVQQMGTLFIPFVEVGNGGGTGGKYPHGSAPPLTVEPTDRDRGDDKFY
jgi:hypothetical protein